MTIVKQLQRLPVSLPDRTSTFGERLLFLGGETFQWAAGGSEPQACAGLDTLAHKDGHNALQGEGEGDTLKGTCLVGWGQLRLQGWGPHSKEEGYGLGRGLGITEEVALGTPPTPPASRGPWEWPDLRVLAGQGQVLTHTRNTMAGGPCTFLGVGSPRLGHSSGGNGSGCGSEQWSGEKLRDPAGWRGDEEPERHSRDGDKEDLVKCRTLPVN